jgi:AraC family transcriptional regulator
MARRRAVRLPEIALGGITVRASRYAPGVVQRPHEHDTGAISLVYRGRLTERVGDREESAEPLSVVVKPPGVRHANRFGPEVAWVLQVLFAPALLEEWRSEWRLGAWRWSHAGEAVRPFLALLQSLRNPPADRDEVEALVFDLLARVGPEEDRSAAAPPPSWLARARERIAEGFDDGLRVRDLARDAGVHPVSLARAFRRQYGTSVTGLIRRRRVVVAASELSGSDRPLSDVALGTGFSDQAHFCRVFKGATGLSPLRYRHLSGR